MWLSCEKDLCKIIPLGWLALLWWCQLMLIWSCDLAREFRNSHILLFKAIQTPGSPLQTLDRQSSWAKQQAGPWDTWCHCSPQPTEPCQQLFRLYALYRSQLICFHVLSSIIGLRFPWDYARCCSNGNGDDGNITSYIDKKLIMLHVTSTSPEPSGISYELCRGALWAPVQISAV